MAAATATTNLELLLRFRGRGSAANDRDVRRNSIAKAVHGTDVNGDLGTGAHVLGGGREGSEAFAARPTVDALARLLEKSGYDRPGHLDARSYSLSASESATTGVWTLVVELPPEVG